MKKSKHLRLLVLPYIASALMLTGCDDAPPETPQPASTFKDVDDCVNSKLMADDQCKAAFSSAKEEHIKSAPRYDSRTSCEQEYGANQCEPHARADGGGDVFLPMMAGFMASQVLNDITRDRDRDRYYGGGYVAPQPLYRHSGDYSGYRTAGNYRVGDVTARTVSVKPSVVTTSVTKTGGFGTQAAARSSWGGSSSSSGS